MDLQTLKEQASAAAKAAGQAYLNKHFNGQDAGACGFAWVTFHPRYSGRTKLGKEERQQFRALGADVDWTGKAYQLWNPSGLPCQNIDAKEEGARAAYEVFKEAGFQVTTGSRLD